MSSEADKLGSQDLQGRLDDHRASEPFQDGPRLVESPTPPPVRLEPPPQIRKPKRRPFKDIRIGGSVFAFHLRQHDICARSQYCPAPPPATAVHTLRVLPDIDPEHAPHFHGFRQHAPPKSYDGNPYVVVGIMGIHHPIARERLVEVTKREGLFRQIRWGCHAVRPLYRRIFSLKHVAGFSMYE
jgi:hypothetical protein